MALKLQKMNIYKIWGKIFIFLTIVIAGCKATLPDNLTFVNDQDIYRNITQIRNVLNNIYSFLPNGFTDVGSSWIATASDEAEEINSASSIQSFNQGNISQFYNPDDVWAKNYSGIYEALVFLKATDTVTWKDFELSDPTVYTARVTLTKQYRAEARFLIAFFYFELVKRYGGVPLVDKIIDKNTDWIRQYPRKSFAECIDFIATYCDSAAKDLPATTDAGNYGRATKGASQALKARAFLYAASDLYNQVGNQNPISGYTDGNRTDRLLKAAQANKAIMDFSPAYSFHATYEGLFSLGSARSAEVIFERRYTTSNEFEKRNTPIGFPFGQTGTCPSGNLVDAYEHITDGRFDWANPAHAANPYANRDPRMAKTIVVNGSKFGKTQDTVMLYYGGTNGKPRDRASKTGYHLRKFMNESLDLTLNETGAKQWIFMRLTEFYLNYAELMNELYGPTGVGTGTLSVSALSALNSVRRRAAVNLPAITTPGNTDNFRELIRRERQVELAFEGHRFWDLKRWIIAGQTIGGNLRGVDIQKRADGNFLYTPFVVENRFWSSRLYYYPIPQSEINKSGGVIVQNESW